MRTLSIFIGVAIYQRFFLLGIRFDKILTWGTKNPVFIHWGFHWGGSSWGTEAGVSYAFNFQYDRPSTANNYNNIHI